MSLDGLVAPIDRRVLRTEKYDEDLTTGIWAVGVDKNHGYCVVVNCTRVRSHRIMDTLKQKVQEDEFKAVAKRVALLKAQYQDMEVTQQALKVALEAGKQVLQSTKADGGSAVAANAAATLGSAQAVKDADKTRKKQQGAAERLLYEKIVEGSTDGDDRPYAGFSGSLSKSMVDRIIGRDGEDGFHSIQQELSELGAETHSASVRKQQIMRSMEKAWRMFCDVQESDVAGTAFSTPDEWKPHRVVVPLCDLSEEDNYAQVDKFQYCWVPAHIYHLAAEYQAFRRTMYQPGDSFVRYVFESPAGTKLKSITRAMRRAGTKATASYAQDVKGTMDYYSEVEGYIPADKEVDLESAFELEPPAADDLETLKAGRELGAESISDGVKVVDGVRVKSKEVALKGYARKNSLVYSEALIDKGDGIEFKKSRYLEYGFSNRSYAPVKPNIKVAVEMSAPMVDVGADRRGQRIDIAAPMDLSVGPNDFSKIEYLDASSEFKRNAEIRLSGRAITRDFYRDNMVPADNTMPFCARKIDVNVTLVRPETKYFRFMCQHILEPETIENTRTVQYVKISGYNEEGEYQTDNVEFNLCTQYIKDLFDNALGNDDINGEIEGTGANETVMLILFTMCWWLVTDDDLAIQLYNELRETLVNQIEEEVNERLADEPAGPARTQKKEELKATYGEEETLEGILLERYSFILEENVKRKLKDKGSNQIPLANVLSNVYFAAVDSVTSTFPDSECTCTMTFATYSTTIAEGVQRNIRDHVYGTERGNAVTFESSPDWPLLRRLVRTAVDSMDFVEVFLDLPGKKRQGEEREADYRTLHSRARPPIVEFGQKRHWYLGSRASPTSQLMSMCLSCCEGVAANTDGAEAGVVVPPAVLASNPDATLELDKDSNNEGFPLTATVAVDWWAQHCDGWAISTIVDADSVVSAGIRVGSELYRTVVWPYLLTQHRRVWCPRSMSEDSAFGPVRPARGAEPEPQYLSKDFGPSGGTWTPNWKKANAARPRIEAFERLLHDHAGRGAHTGGLTQQLLRSMATIDDDEGAIVCALRLYVRTDHGAESLCVARNFYETTPRFAVARSMVMNAVRSQTLRFPRELPQTSRDALAVAMVWPVQNDEFRNMDGKLSGEAAGGPIQIDTEECEEAAVVGCRDFRAAMVAAGAVVAHERYALGYSDPRGLSTSTAELDRAVAGIVRELRTRRKKAST